MKPVGVIGPGADEAARRLVTELGSHGRVALVGREGTTTDEGALRTGSGATTRYVIDDDGSRLFGPSRTLPEALDDLAPDHDYAVVTGYPESRIPAVLVGDMEAEGEVVATLDAGGRGVDNAVESIESIEPHETLESLVSRAKESSDADRAGAIATFTGRVRERDNPDDARTTRLEFEAYEDVARERMAAIAEELEARAGVYQVLMHHRTGIVEAGEDIVFVVVLAGHRPEAFATVSDGIERLKAEVPIFKKEVTVEQEFWAHERQ